MSPFLGSKRRGRLRAKTQPGSDQIDGSEARDQAQPGDGRVHGPEEDREIQICAPGKGLSGGPNEQAFLEVRIGDPEILDCLVKRPARTQSREA
jgi:hypothetical protein